MSEFNIFGAATKDSIRVGYVDPDRGYISANSIYEANLYASKNPGAVFILETRDKIRYLSINEVNELTPKDLEVGGVCPDGIKGLRPGETPTYGGGRHPIVVNGDILLLKELELRLVELVEMKLNLEEQVEI